MSVSAAPEDRLWELMVAGDLSRAEELFQKHRRELLAYTSTQLGASGRSSHTGPEDIVQECFVRLLHLARRLQQLHQCVQNPELVELLRQELIANNRSSNLSDLAGWLKRIIKQDPSNSRHATASVAALGSALSAEYAKRTQNFQIRAWLFAAAKTQITDTHRSSRRTQAWEDDFDPPALPLSEESHESGSRLPALADCLQELSEDNRCLLQIRFSSLDPDSLRQVVDGISAEVRDDVSDASPAEALLQQTRRKNFTYAQLAARLGLSDGALGKRMRKLYEQLKSCIERRSGGVV
jgi:RNA polymerase sigma factor (sigma-70 family)